MKIVDFLALVRDEGDVVDVRNEGLESVFVAFVWRQGFGVDCGVFVSDVVVILPCEL